MDLLEGAQGRNDAKLSIQALPTSLEVLDQVLQNENKVAFTTNLLATEKEGLMAVMDFAGRTPTRVGIGLQKGSELEGSFNYHVLDMHQSGLQRKLFQKWVLKKPKDDSLRIFVEESKPIEAESLYFPTFVLLLGICCGCLVAMAEKSKGAVVARSPCEI